ncbi:CBO0543 family protein [Bacillus sp. UNC438CL73TsuS30]|uniref:CBO0543 family protein n=1 Tax=Bacillus sp. UNC438CL73TsuS30 TaxID=1340434 RepID=UPI000479F3DB|nr:CBO0543 family protein [Bacillus sp. UNC438CL73TsuS30]
MKSDYLVLLLLWLIFPISLWKVIPRSRLREAIATLLLFQMLTWLFSIYLTYFGLLESPVRIFKHATKINFTMEYLAFPFFALLFQLKFPKNAHFIRRVLHYFFWIGIMLTFMFLMGKFTNIMKISMENLIRSFFNFIIELWICRRYVLWIMAHPDFERLETNED